MDLLAGDVGLVDVQRARVAAAGGIGVVDEGDTVHQGSPEPDAGVEVAIEHQRLYGLPLVGADVARTGRIVDDGQVDTARQADDIQGIADGWRHDIDGRGCGLWPEVASFGVDETRIGDDDIGTGAAVKGLTFAGYDVAQVPRATRALQAGLARLPENRTAQLQQRVAQLEYRSGTNGVAGDGRIVDRERVSAALLDEHLGHFVAGDQGVRKRDDCIIPGMHQAAALVPLDDHASGNGVIPSGEETSAGLDVGDRSTSRLVVGIDGRVAEDAAARTAGCAWCRGRIALLLDNDTGAGTIAEEVRFPLRVDGGPLGRRVGDDFGFHQVDMRTDGGIAEGLGAPGIEGATAGRCDVVGYREMGCVIVCLEQYRDGRLAVATPVADHGDSATVDSRVAEDAGEEIASG